MKLNINSFKIDLVAVLLGICPVFFIAENLSPTSMRMNQIEFMHFMAALMLACVFFNRWLGAFMLLSLAHRFIFNDLPFFGEYILCFGFGMLLYHLVATYYKGKKYPYVILAVMIFNLVMAVFQMMHRNVLFGQMEPNGMFTLPSYLGMYCAIGAPVIATIHPALIIFPIIGLGFSKSSFSVMAFVISMAFYFWHTQRRWVKKIWWTIPFALVLSAGLVKRGVSGDEMSRRMHVWPMVAWKAFRSPFVGAGVGNYGKTAYIEFRGKENYYFTINIKPENDKAFEDKIIAIAKKEHVPEVNLERLRTIHFKMPGGPFYNFKDIGDELRGAGLSSYEWENAHCLPLTIFLEHRPNHIYKNFWLDWL